jgi:hypothetical protein
MGNAMTEEAKRPPAGDWRIGAAIGAAIGVSLPVSKAVERNLEAQIGSWPAMFVGFAAAGLVAAVAAIVLLKVLERWKNP